jgi:hypothetical protein
MINHGLVSASALRELRESELSRPALIGGVSVLVATQLGIDEYHVIN